MATQRQTWFPKFHKSTQSAFSVIGAYSSDYNWNARLYIVEEPPQKRLIFYAPWNHDDGDNRRKGIPFVIPLPWIYHLVRVSLPNEWNNDVSSKIVKTHFALKQADSLQSLTYAPVLPNNPGTYCTPCTPEVDLSRKRDLLDKPNALIEQVLNSYWLSEFNEDGAYWEHTVTEYSELLPEMFELFVKNKIVKPSPSYAKPCQKGECDHDYYDDAHDLFVDSKYSTKDFLKALSQVDVRELLCMKPRGQFMLENMLSMYIPPPQIKKMTFNFGVKYKNAKALRS